VNTPTLAQTLACAHAHKHVWFEKPYPIKGGAIVCQELSV